MELRSEQVRCGVMRAPHRSLLKADGLTDEELARPLVAVLNSRNDIIPGHNNLDKIAEAVKAGIYMAGGIPFEISTIGVCDGIAMNHDGMHYSLVSREAIADSVECAVQGHAFDALVCIPNCDKIVPGMILGALRVNIPTVFVSGGAMLAGKQPGGEAPTTDLNTLFDGAAAVLAGKMTEDELKYFEDTACPTCGSCSGLFTANSMNCLCEALGIALPGNGTIPAVYSARIRLAKQAGMKVMELLEAGLCIRDVVSAAAIHNAMECDMAFGGSTNTVLHLTAIAREAGHPITMDDWDAASARTPHLVKLAPSGPRPLSDLDEVGGVPVVMHELDQLGLLDRSAQTIMGSLPEYIENYTKPADGVVCRTYDNPLSPQGALCVLHGNLAPHGGIVKKSAVDPAMMVHTGPARVFNSEEEACEVINAGGIHPGDVVVIRYEGPKGGPGMREMLTPTSSIVGMGLSSSVALITDGRFSDRVTGKLDEFAPDAQVIHIDIDPAEIGKVRDTQVPVVGDARRVLAAINAQLHEDGAKSNTEAWVAQVFAWREAYPMYDERLDEASTGHIVPEHALRQLSDALDPAKTIVVTEVGQHQMWAAQFIDRELPRTFLSSGGLGTMGFGLPAAIGAAFGMPDKTVVCIAGDGSLQMNVQEMGTAAANNIPVKVVVIDNRALGMVRQWQKLFYDKRYSQTEFAEIPDFVKLAEAYSWGAEKVEAPNDVEAAIVRMLEADGPYLLDICIPREQSVFPMMAPGAALADIMGAVTYTKDNAVVRENVPEGGMD